MDTCLTVILLHDYCTQTYTNQHKLYFFILYCNFICVLSVVIIKTDDDDDDDSSKYLGLYIDDDLKWKNHIEYIYGKLLKVLCSAKLLWFSFHKVDT